MHTPAHVSIALAHTGLRQLARAASLATALTSLALVAGEFGSDEGAVEASDTSACATTFDTRASYPMLPESAGPDLSGEAGVVVHLQQHRGVVELGDCLYQLDRPLEIAFEDLDAVALLLELHDEFSTSTELFVSTAGTVETHTLDQAFAVFSLTPETSELGFEIAAPGQSAPTVPVVIAKPVDDGPPPK